MSAITTQRLEIRNPGSSKRGIPAGDLEQPKWYQDMSRSELVLGRTPNELTRRKRPPVPGLWEQELARGHVTVQGAPQSVGTEASR